MGMIYHYTDAGALLNIIGNNTLWATHILHLNDPNEYLLPKKIAQEIVQEIDYQSSQMGLVTHLGLGFVVCFSEKFDDLNQFRSYADDGKGYVVGFDSQELVDSLGISHPNLQKIVYGEDDIRAFLKERLSLDKAHWDDQIKIAEDKMDAASSGPIIPGLSALLRHFPEIEIGIYSCKSKHYKEEREVRIIVNPFDLRLKIEYRSRGHRIIPYIKLKAPNGNILPIKEIIVGPGHDPSTKEITAAAIKDFCTANKHGQVVVKSSNIDYRPSR